MYGNPWKFTVYDIVWIFSRLREVVVEFALRNSIFAIFFSKDNLDDEAPRAELDLKYKPNWSSLFTQIILFFVTLPVFIFYPIMMVLAMEPDVLDYIRRPKRAERAGEKWFFVNGVAVNNQWLDQNCKYLEARFDRGVTGLLNNSYGVIWDIVECVFGRSFEIDTMSVLFVTDEILKALRDDKIQTVVFVSHSQGAIISNLAIKRIFLELSKQGTKEQELLKKLEVYTFANPCRDFENPGGYIRRIEHYANKLDTISRLGVLNEDTNKSISGDIFVNSSRNGGKGHLFNTYYSLDAADYQSIRPMGTNSKLLAIDGKVKHLPIDISKLHKIRED